MQRLSFWWIRCITRSQWQKIMIFYPEALKAKPKNSFYAAPSLGCATLDQCKNCGPVNWSLESDILLMKERGREWVFWSLGRVATSDFPKQATWGCYKVPHLRLFWGPKEKPKVGDRGTAEGGLLRKITRSNPSLAEENLLPPEFFHKE